MALRQRAEKKGVIVQAIPSMGISGHGKHRSGTFYIHRESAHNDNHHRSLTSSKYPMSKVSIPAHAIHSINCHSGKFGSSQAMSRKGHAAPHHVALSTSSRMMQFSSDTAIPSQHGLWRLRPNIALHFDVHQQKVLSKKNQAAASKRNLLPYLPGTHDDIFAIADVIEVPPELFQLEDLKGVLCIEAWKGCLSPSERKFLRSLLPEGVDPGRLVRSLLGGDNFHFGNPLADWDKLLLKGELHPDHVQQRESDAKQAYMDHHREAQRYHEKMLKTLRVLKEEWIKCKSSGKKKLHSSTRRRKIGNDGLNASSGGASSRGRKSKRQKLGNSQGVTARTTVLPPAECEPKIDNGANSDAGTPSVHIIKVSRKQYTEIMHLLEGKGDELSIAALSPILSSQQRVEADVANANEQREALKIRAVWSSLVEDIPAAHSNFYQHRAHKERLAKSAAEQCSQFYSVFVSKDERDVSNSAVSCKPQESAVELEESIGAEIEEHKHSSASESSVTYLEGQIGDNQDAVDSCGSSAQTENPGEDEQICLINLPGGASPVGESHATLLSSVQVQSSLESNDVFQDEKSSSVHTDSNQAPKSDKTSGCYKVSVMKSFCSSKDLDTQEFRSCHMGIPAVDENGSLQSTEKDLINWELQSKPGSEVVSAAAASDESEEVEQREDLQAGGNLCNGLDQQSFLFSGPSTLLVSHEDLAENNPFNTQDNHALAAELDEKDVKGNPCGRLPVPAAADKSSSFSQLDHVHFNDYTRAFGMEASRLASVQNKRRMLHTFLDQRSHAGEILSTDLSHCHDLGGHMLMKEQEPIRELSLLVDNRSADQRSLCEPAESISSRRGGEFYLNESGEPHWMARNTKQVFPFSQHNRESYNLLQDGYSFTPTIPGWFNPQQIPLGAMSQPFNSFMNHWNGGSESGEQSNWTSTEAVTLPFFSSMNVDGARASPALPNWEHMSGAPGIGTVPSKHEQGFNFFRGTSQVLQGHDIWDHLLQPQSLSQPSYVWPNDKNGLPASQAWKNSSMLPQYEHQQLQSACLSKNFKASWH